MEFKITHYEFGQRPAVTMPSGEFINHLKEEGIRKMVSDHYDLIKVSEIGHLFPKIDEAFEKAKQRSSDFFIQVCGGHSYYLENRGKPMLVSRHLPFKIRPEDRVVWLRCYARVLTQMALPEPVLQSFWDYLNVFSAWMVNTKE